MSGHIVLGSDAKCRSFGDFISFSCGEGERWSPRPANTRPRGAVGNEMYKNYTIKLEIPETHRIRLKGRV